MEAPWLCKVLNMLEDMPWYCPVVKDVVMDVSVGQVLKGLPYLHCCSELCRQGFSSSTCQAVVGGIKCLPAMFERIGRLVCSRGHTENAISANKLVFWFIHLGLAWFHVQLVFTILLFQLFWNLIIMYSWYLPFCYFSFFGTSSSSQSFQSSYHL